MQKIVRKLLRAVADCDPDYYDMYADANEAWFGQLYLKRILRHAQAVGIRPGASLLEAGCQAGRLAIPLARQGFHVTGIDTSRFALRRAREHAKAAGVRAEFIQGDLIRILSDHRQRRFDVVVCAEVVYLSRQHQVMLQALAHAVKPGGLLCVSHRPKFYYLLEALRQYDLESASKVLLQHEGAFRDSTYFNWQTERELRAQYASLGVQWIDMHPIDQFAWLSGMSPSQLTNEERSQWLQLELQSEQAPMCARYVLVVAMKPK